MTIRAHKVSWTRGGNLVLDDVTLVAEPGEMIGILGPNGSGKSSLLRALGGLARPQLGEVSIDGTDITTIRRRQLARRVAVVSQHATTDVDLSVIDVVRLGRIPHRSTFGDDDHGERVVAEVLARTGLASKAHDRWHTLSGGEKQRAQIARALAQEPAELLLDEPTNHLDIRHQLELLGFVASLGITSYAALHDLNLAAMFCHRVMVLCAGRVVGFGSPAQVITAEMIAEVYGVDANVEVSADGMASVRFAPPMDGMRRRLHCRDTATADLSPR
ncbi:ABC transporter ATP-binding protein [Gordonia sp. zg691]|uniref:ABC transporter ATP-binding protein n=1 Tax=Gordonia jinghuaiqii TaxID=2758710 RepID=UPI001662592B|nr:ABC transporter ATP-binding protein [Gordonia jinghuaiqii]MBD0862048.1 ABC transporter ATP-binding protein [Gordonia jinghuaiqii]